MTNVPRTGSKQKAKNAKTLLLTVTASQQLPHKGLVIARPSPLSHFTVRAGTAGKGGWSDNIKADFAFLETMLAKFMQLGICKHNSPLEELYGLGKSVCSLVYPTWNVLLTYTSSNEEFFFIPPADHFAFL